MANEMVKIDFSQDQINLIRSQIAPKATDDELKLFIYQAKRTGLDPLARQIYAIHRKQNGVDKMTIQTSIDGFRVIAERSGDYAGQDEPEFDEDVTGPLKATVKVYRFRGDIRYCASVGVAYWSEYVPMYNGNPSGLWAKMPHTMLAKVAEALALRKAYPQDLSGLYTAEEMNQADTNGKEKQPEADFSDVPDESERNQLRHLLYSSDLSIEEKEKTLAAIDTLQTYAKYEYIESNLQNRQPSIDQISNPNQRDINKHLKKVTNNGE